jgi:Ca2+-binding RTX toxin-like protein
MTTFTGTAGNDSFTGSFTNDTFDLRQGGDDVARGMSGGDTFSMGAEFGAGDRLDGGAANDGVYLDGDYSGGLTVLASMARNVEAFYLFSGFSYDLTLVDAVNQSSFGMTITAQSLAAGNYLHFNGARETVSSFLVYGGAGDDRLVGGEGNDGFYLYPGGEDLAVGGGGQDFYQFNAALDQGDRIDGGDGRDTIYLSGEYNLAFKANTVRGIEQMYLADGFDYRLRLHDNTVAAGEQLSIQAYQLTGVHRARLDGSRELDGNLYLTGGEGRDTLLGGAADDQLQGDAGRDSLVGGDGDDWLWGGAGRDEMTGGSGQDTFTFVEGDSSTGNPDLMVDLALSDVVDVAQIDADTTQDFDQAFTLVGHFTGAAGQLDLVYDSGLGVTHFLMDTDGDGLSDITVDATGNRTGFTQFVL